MSTLINSRPGGSWFLAILIWPLVLGHVCDLSAFAPVDAHHSANHHGDEQISSCDTMPATSSPGHAQMWTVLDLGAALQMAPARLAVRPVYEPVRLVDRPPLFLLHASLLI